MNLWLSCQWPRSVFSDPQNTLPPSLLDIGLPSSSPWMNPLWSLPSVDWKTTPLPPALYGAKAGSMPLPVDGPDSPGYAIAQSYLPSWAQAARILGNPQEAANAQLGTTNYFGLDETSAAVPMFDPSTNPNGSFAPDGGAVPASPQFLPANLFQPMASCEINGNCSAGLGNLEFNDKPNIDKLVFLADRPQPSIVHKTDPLVFADRREDTSDWVCRFARWVDANPGLAAGLLVAIYLVRRNKR
jgi:hypothetical protein